MVGPQQRQQQPVMLLLLLLASAMGAMAAAGGGGDAAAPPAAAASAAEQQQQQQLPPYVSIMLDFDGIDQEQYDQSYRLGARLAVAFAAGLEGNRSSVLTVAAGDYAGAVAAFADARRCSLHKRAQAAGGSGGSGGGGAASTTNATAARAGAAPPAAPAAAAAPAPLSGVQKWLAGFVAPASKLVKSEASNRRLLSWRSLLSSHQSADSSSSSNPVQDVPATVETIPATPAAPAAPTPEAAAADAPASKVTAARPAAAPEGATVAAPAAPPATDDAQYEDGSPAAAGGDAAGGSSGEDLPFEGQGGALQAHGEFAIVTDSPEEVRRRVQEAAANFGMGFYSLLHKFGVAQKPSLFLDGTPILGPAAEAANPAAYDAAAAAAGLDGSSSGSSSRPAEDSAAAKADDTAADALTPASEDEDPLPDARIAPRQAANRASAPQYPVRIGVTRGFDQHASHSSAAGAGAGASASDGDDNGAQAPSSSARKTIDGVPLWVFVPLVVLASLLGVALIAATAMFGLRATRNYKAISAAKREAAAAARSDSESGSGSEDDEEGVYGAELIKHQHGGYLATTMALAQLNGLEKGGLSLDDDDRATITSLQTGVTAATTYVSTSALLDSSGHQHSTSSSGRRQEKPIVSGIRVPSRSELYNASLDGLLTAAGIGATAAGAAATAAATAAPRGYAASAGPPGSSRRGAPAPPPPPPPPPPPASLARFSPRNSSSSQMMGAAVGPPPPAPPPPPFPLTRGSPVSSPRVLARNSSTGPGGVLQPPAGLMVRTRVGGGPDAAQGSPGNGNKTGTPVRIDPQAIARAAAAAAARRAQSQSIGN